ncbi:MAG: 50S ribosomal protein L18 [Bacteroidota bacterium]|nr:50S ribosomal protein L18 [Bacteroidota bacterium]
MALTKRQRRRKIKKRVRKNISGTPQRPRFSVFRSSNHIYAQLIDDISGNTLVSASSLDKEIASSETKNPKHTAVLVGSKLGEAAKSAEISSAIFDRNGYRYHGRIKSLADAARKAGLKF